MVIGVVEPPIGMVTKPIGTPAAANSRAASSVPASFPRGVTVPSSAEIGGSARSASPSPPQSGQRHRDRGLRHRRLDDRHGLHVLARVDHRQVELVQATGRRGPVLRADRRPAEVKLGHAVDDPRDRRHVVSRGGALLATGEVVDLDAAAVCRHQRAVSGLERRRRARSEREPRRRQRDQTAHELGAQPDARAIGDGTVRDKRRPGAL